jgi:1-acyl-sn-glycerol-3-phosphate acyltransferase
MLYHLMRNLVKFALHFYIRRIGWEGVQHIPTGQPVLFCGSHSNSFLDSLFICVYLQQPVYVLARGDAFRNPKARWALNALKVLPIFRQSEGEAEAAAKNQLSFDRCHALFQENQYVLIFPEAVAAYQTEILPLKKGAANMVQRAWQAGIPVQVIPMGVTYSSFKDWGKKCDVAFSAPLTQHDFEGLNNDFFQENFNTVLKNKLEKLFPSPYQYQGEKTHWGIFGQLLYYVGWLFHFPIFFLTRWISNRFAGKTVFYDSVVIGVLAVLLLLYYIGIAGLFYF